MKKVAILAVTALITFCTVQAQDNVPQKMSFDKYGIHTEKNRLGRQYVYKIGNDKEEIRLPKGNYLIERDEEIEGARYDESFQFIIDDSGQFCDSAMWMVEKEVVTFFYENGIAVRSKGVFAETGVLYSEMELGDSVQTAIIYHPSGKIREKETVYLNHNYAEILELYYENGNIKSQSDRLRKTYMSWYENGNQRSIENHKDKTRTRYNEDGTIDSHQTPSEVTEYIYKDGKLEYYTVENMNTHVSKKYDSDGNLLNDNANDPIPETTISIQY